jgi:ADP-ribosylglycohydrolase
MGVSPADESNFSAVMLGVAYGDSWGYPNERHSYGRLTLMDMRGPELPERLIVSDDTQMTLYLAQAVDGAAGKSAGELQSAILAGWLGWLHDPDMRGYGRTTMKALRALHFGEPWYRATVVDSDACGAVMRVSPCGFLPDGLWQPVSAWQAATTHGGPAAIASALLAAAVLRRIIIASDPHALVSDGLLSHAIELSHDDAMMSTAAPWLIDHPRAGNLDAATDLIRNGMVTVREAVQQARDVTPKFLDDPWFADPSLPRYGGEGWRSPQALACALLCVDMLPGEPVEALRRAVTTGGDSDTLGAIAGFFLGSVHGNVWPQHWLTRLEPRFAAWTTEAGAYVFD